MTERIDVGRPVVVEHESPRLERESACEPGRGLAMRGVLERHRLEVTRIDLHPLVDVLREIHKPRHRHPPTFADKDGAPDRDALAMRSNSSSSSSRFPASEAALTSVRMATTCSGVALSPTRSRASPIESTP